MPRHNLNTVMPLVKEFAAANGLPYMVDDYFTGFWLEIEQFRNIANVAAKLTKKIA
ncbi:Delta(5) fatty acid desaturase fat-4 [Caenorhabditis elegans]|nr:Delta(5) fatty acid desaturase fat-4 [Caenorhabditis elegans]CBZ01822.1 Delta(5) fatty acid desaturase fat-4 [Caenorhabditis elegans]|eukprot:NP_001255425.1 Delta(5) fatty acid desaturase fat-4 [Caenorhabditis elegans]